jgi:hypothetical protein
MERRKEQWIAIILYIMTKLRRREQDHAAWHHGIGRWVISTRTMTGLGEAVAFAGDYYHTMSV